MIGIQVVPLWLTPINLSTLKPPESGNASKWIAQLSVSPSRGAGKLSTSRSQPASKDKTATPTTNNKNRYFDCISFLLPLT